MEITVSGLVPAANGTDPGNGCQKAPGGSGKTLTMEAAARKAAAITSNGPIGMQQTTTTE
jgi:hypothetical protein